MSKIILFGSSGYIGSEFDKQLGDSVIGKPSHSWFSSYKQVAEYIRGNMPDFIINAAGYTGKPNVDACEDQKDKCYFGNVIFPLWIAQACQQYDIPFGHVSSGCIYNGYEKEYTENDVPDFSFKQNNCSFYSGTKAHSEELLKQFQNTYIWRLRIPFNNENNPRNYLTKLLNYGTILNLPNSVSHREEFVETCIKTWKKEIPYGIYNVTNTGKTDAKTVLNLFCQYQRQYCNLIESKKYFESVEHFMKTSRAPRSNCVMDTSKLKYYGLEMRHVEEAIIDSIKNYQG